MISTRHLVIDALLRVTADGGYSTLVLDKLIRENKLDSRDTAFAGALFYGIIERKLTLDYLIAHYSKNKLSPAVREILRIGFFQLLYMNGVDDYAAVSETVNLTREFGQPKASGLVNGVLRSFLRNQKQIPPVSGSESYKLSIAYSAPEPLIILWQTHYGKAAALRILENSIGKPPIFLRVNTSKCTTEELVERLRAEHVVCQAEPDVEGCVITSQLTDIDRLPAFREGLFHVQDKAAQLCAAAADPAAGMRILDVCAAPGGKSFTLAQLMGQGEVVAMDLYGSRVKLIQEGAQRLGIDFIKARKGDATVYQESLGCFDRVLCDVPCSGFGIIRRKPEIKYKSMESIEKLPETQYKILQTSSQYLKAGGVLIYSTCTLNPAENQRVVARFLQENPGFKQLEQPRTYTGEENTDGFFIARLTR